MFTFRHTEKPTGYAFNLRDNIALQAMHNLLAAGRFQNSYAGAAAEGYEIADAFIERFVSEKKADK